MPLQRPSIGLSLGGGGAAGLGHIAVLEALDDLGVRPTCIVGTSIGALIGAAYSSGMSGTQIRAFVQDLSDSPVRTVRRLSPSFGFSGWGAWPALDPLTIVTKLLGELLPEEFEGLNIPLTVIATDYYQRKETLFTQGPLLPAIAGSMAIPAVFRPIAFEGAIYVDGGITNNQPYDRLNDVDITLAVEVASKDPKKSMAIPSPIDVSVGAIRTMNQTMLEAKLQIGAPDILIRPQSRAFGPLD
ncbi:MAG: patatin-like phospholipase family protein, partial [Pseudomonadota bacterium]